LAPGRRQNRKESASESRTNGGPHEPDPNHGDRGAHRHNKAGDVLFIPAGTIHSARNVGTGRAAELATYVVEKGKPLLTVVQ
jgi:hypothetical protein